MIATVVITLIICAIVALIIISKIRNKKKGLSGCGCGCQSCAMSNVCHKE